jgi:hypothetical protein
VTLTELRYWQWLSAAIAAVLIALVVHRWTGQDAGAASILADLSGPQQRFERALSGRVQGQPLLRNITVYLQHITGADGVARPVHLVTAQYCAGSPEQYDGARRYVWRESIFVFPIPYRPTPDLAQSDPALAAAFAKRSPHDGKATVLDLLAAARSVHGIGYSYAWWDAHFLLVVGGGCVLLLGVILPNVLHVARFGQLKRPRIRKARVAAPAAIGAASETSADEAVPPPTSQDGPPTAPAPIPALNAKPIEAMAQPPANSDDPAEFGMNRDDYYPTERHHAERTPAK